MEQTPNPEVKTQHSKLIITCAPESGADALREVRHAGSPVRLLAWLDAGVALLSTPDAAALAEALVAAPPVFVRHLAPAEGEVPLAGHTGDIDAITAAVGAADWLPDELQGPYAVQVRLSSQGRFPYTRYAVAEPLRQLLARHGTEDVRRPQQVLAVYCTPGRAYLGLWPVARCLSDWPGGERHFARTPTQVSRSEFKLLEALEVFRLELPAPGRALDLGAAPGGWTRLLVERGFTVVAVDPADLDPRVARLAQVHYWRGHAAQFIATHTEQFDIIVNDMRVDARDSARLMLRAAQRLRPGGLALITLKLPQTAGAQVYRQAYRLLESAYTVIGARQLFHNRSEVTLALVRAERAGPA